MINQSDLPDIAVVVPFFQRTPGLLTKAVTSAFHQTLASRVVVIVVDDSSPIDAAAELRTASYLPHDRIIVERQPNAGAGAARNRALSLVPPGIQTVAFLDSDDEWLPHHLERALAALALGFDVYFADFIAVGYPGVGNMARIGNMHVNEHPLVEPLLGIRRLGCSALDHTVADGGGLIGTSTVVFAFNRFRQLRFREEFFNGQDFFFWMDLSELGATFAFSFEIECRNGEGVNIFQASGWGTERSLHRLRNELFVWTSVNRFYQLKPPLLRANATTIRHLQRNVGLDILHRISHRQSISLQLIADIVKMAPSTLWVTPVAMVGAIWRKATASWAN